LPDVNPRGTIALRPAEEILVFSTTRLPAVLSKPSAKAIKEPVYAGKPGYCLLVFGVEARVQVWLVLDGDTLYADLAGDGDLTRPDAKVTLPPMKSVQAGLFEASRKVVVGSVKEGRLTHTELTLMQRRVRKGYVPTSPEEKAYMRLLGDDKDREVVEIHLSVDRGGTGEVVKQSAGEDAGGLLRFAARAMDAPVIHFNGPWSMGLCGGQQLAPGDPPAVLKATVGTPGFGAGTFAAAEFRGLVPIGAHPVAEVTFPPAPEGRPVTVRAELPRRC
jgi:hypothetical protein